MAWNRLTLKTDEELATSSPEAIDRRRRVERQKRVAAAAALTGTAVLGILEILRDYRSR